MFEKMKKQSIVQVEGKPLDDQIEKFNVEQLTYSLFKHHEIKRRNNGLIQ